MTARVEPARAPAVRAHRAERARDRRARLGAEAIQVERELAATVPVPVPHTGDVAEVAEWQANAACAGMDVELFFTRHIGAEVRAVCLGCPVRAHCLGLALSYPVSASMGFFGGTTQQQRVRIKRAARDTDVTPKALDSADESPQVNLR